MQKADLGKGQLLIKMRNDDESYFDTNHLLLDLKNRVVKGTFVTVAGQIAKFVIQIASTMILARLLTPADFGLIGMVSVFTGFISLFKDLGLSMATVQRYDINHDQVSTLFWINLTMSCVVMFLVVSLAPIIAWFFREPRLLGITLALSVTLIFSGLTVQHQALLSRQMLFIRLIIIEIVSNLIGITVAVSMAFMQFKYWSIVGMIGATSITNFVLAWSLCAWRPGLPKQATGVSEMLGFGKSLAGFNILNYFARNMDNLLIGRVWGSYALGVYSKAYGLLMLPIRQITSPIATVAIPALSRLQNNPVEFARYYYRATNTIALVTIPLILFMASLSKEFILLVLGDQWIDAAIIFKVLTLAALFQPVVNPVGWVFVSLGQTDRQMKWSFVAAPLTVLSFLIGIPWGPLGVAVSYTICSLTVLTLPGLWWSFQKTPLTIGGWFDSIRCPLIIGICTFIIIGMIKSFLSFMTPLPLILVLCFGWFSLFFLIIMIWKKARDEVYFAFRLLRTSFG